MFQNTQTGSHRKLEMSLRVFAELAVARTGFEKGGRSCGCQGPVPRCQGNGLGVQDEDGLVVVDAVEAVLEGFFEGAVRTQRDRIGSGAQLINRSSQKV